MTWGYCAKEDASLCNEVLSNPCASLLYKYCTAELCSDTVVLSRPVRPPVKNEVVIPDHLLKEKAAL